VSKEVADVVLTTGLCHGPVLAIPNAIDLSLLPPVPRHKAVDIFVDGIKKPEIAKRLGRRFWRPGRKVDVLTERVLRDEYLARVAAARIAVFLPNETEGFYLPAVEAMALDTLVVCPDCVGNRSFCHAGENCLFPALTYERVRDALREALSMDDPARARMLAAGRETAAWHDLPRERRQVHDLLDRIDELWGSVL